MGAKPKAMEDIKAVIRLHRDGFSNYAIQEYTGISLPTIRKYLNKVKQQDITADQVLALDDKALFELCLQPPELQSPNERMQQLTTHFCYAEQELKKTGVTRQLLWLEYKELHPDGYHYSQYCNHFSEYLKNKEVVMHLEHKAAEVLMIDFAGKKLSYTHADTAEIIQCQVFVAVLPHSGLLFCYAVHSQNTADLITCINEMLQYYGGVPLSILCDNLKTAVTRPCRYEPLFTDVCYQLSEHYETSFSATRPYHPRDKAMVERAVNICYTHIYAPLRSVVFTSLKQLNAAIKEQLNLLNEKPYKGSAYSRKDLFEQSEKALLRPLPQAAFTLKRSVIATVQRNYHIQLTEDHHYYSVPYRYAGKKVRVLYDSKTLEIYLDQQRIALHARTSMGSAYHTIAEHMPSNHQYALNIKGWTKGDLLAAAQEIGPCAHKAVEHILLSSFYPEQNFKSAYGVLMLVRAYEKTRVEAACARVLTGTRINYTLIKNILKAGLDRKPLIQEDPVSLPLHDNIRGAAHYQ
jgi:transposase